jgi:hypothetical protein
VLALPSFANPDLIDYFTPHQAQLEPTALSVELMLLPAVCTLEPWALACQEFITQLGRNFQVIYEQANQHGQKVQTAGNNMSSTDCAVGSSWA